jgi:hypothetical protein
MIEIFLTLEHPPMPVLLEDLLSRNMGEGTFGGHYVVWNHWFCSWYLCQYATIGG